MKSLANLLCVALAHCCILSQSNLLFGLQVKSGVERIAAVDLLTQITATDNAVGAFCVSQEELSLLCFHEKKEGDGKIFLELFPSSIISSRTKPWRLDGIAKSGVRHPDGSEYPLSELRTYLQKQQIGLVYNQSPFMSKHEKMLSCFKHEIPVFIRHGREKITFVVPDGTKFVPGISIQDQTPRVVRKLLPVGEIGFDEVWPWLIWDVKIEKSQGALLLSGKRSKHEQVELPTAVLSVPADFERFPRAIFDNVKFDFGQLEFRSSLFSAVTSVEFKNVPVAIINTESGDFDFDSLKLYFEDGKNGFLVTESQKIHPELGKMVKASVPIFRMTTPKVLGYGRSQPYYYPKHINNAAEVMRKK